MWVCHMSEYLFGHVAFPYPPHHGWVADSPTATMARASQCPACVRSSACVRERVCERECVRECVREFVRAARRRRV